MELAVVGASQATIKSLLSKLGSLLAEEYSLIKGVRGDIQFITDELASMQAFLSNLAKCGGEGRHDDQTEDWMKQVRDVSYDIEDCIDDFAHKIRRDPRGTGWITAVLRTLYEIQTCSTRRRIAVQIVDLKNRAQQVGERRRRYGVRDPQPGKAKGLAGLTEHDAAEHQQITRQLVRIKQPVGTDMQDLENWIVDEKRKKLGVLSVVGFGGVGKTTIAMELYRKLAPKFERRAVVTVSQTSDLEMVLRNIPSQVQKQANTREQHAKGSQNSTLEKKIPDYIGSILSRLKLPSRNEEGFLQKHRQIQEDLTKYLGENRYLLLIDDIWSSSSWLYIKKYFPENDKGSRIIVTTRIQAVAKTCSPCKDNDRVRQVKYLSGYSLQSLVIVDESSEFLKTLDSMPSYPTDLSALELSGRLLKLPKWLHKLKQLVKLTLSATALCTDNLQLLSKLGSLFSLTFSISEKKDPALAAILQKNRSDSGGEVFVPTRGFSKLKLLRIFIPILPSLNFGKNSTPELERIELRFKRFEGLHGMDKLQNLHDVLLTMDGQASDRTKSIIEGLKKTSSKYSFIVNERND
ncbi:unnamed protein product [Urochloa decumbens]|uniref:Uncharacterized protein n=1 Tax=Urochloa decumbens TaxID=240449 RepID=A0ABC9AZP5_9POAL